MIFFFFFLSLPAQHFYESYNTDTSKSINIRCWSLLYFILPADVDECSEDRCGDKKSTSCINTQGSYYCMCNSGYKHTLDKTNFTVLDGQCQGKCVCAHIFLCVCVCLLNYTSHLFRLQRVHWWCKSHTLRSSWNMLKPDRELQVQLPSWLRFKWHRSQLRRWERRYQTPAVGTSCSSTSTLLTLSAVTGWVCGLLGAN